MSSNAVQLQQRITRHDFVSSTAQDQKGQESRGELTFEMIHMWFLGAWLLLTEKQS